MSRGFLFCFSLVFFEQRLTTVVSSPLSFVSRPSSLLFRFSNSPSIKPFLFEMFSSSLRGSLPSHTGAEIFWTCTGDIGVRQQCAIFSVFCLSSFPSSSLDPAQTIPQPPPSPKNPEHYPWSFLEVVLVHSTSLSLSSASVFGINPIRACFLWILSW
mmetsp:Transcript_30483/g.62877  ORF Transcript_30483/g.62877 Transcript_30483/m.62877 type:complete len:157 (+) Transcript_30483:1156-1626(+)